MQFIILLIVLPVNILIFGLANKKIAKDFNKKEKIYFWLGILGPLGLIITLASCVEITGKKIGYGFLRFVLWAVLISVFGELTNFPNTNLITGYIGIPFIFRGRSIFNY